jgi:hypothetical protein
LEWGNSREKMKRICIIHPEGNINNNPNLTGIVEILCEQGYEIDIFSHFRPEIYQCAPCQGSKLMLENIENLTQYENILNYKFNQNYFLIIGVDGGIIEAEVLAKLLNVPYGLISYEIFFADEVGSENKKLEINACKNINFAIVSDNIRGSHLSIENEINPNKFFYIPVAGRTVKKQIKQNYWHDKFNIPYENKIALFIGTVDKCNMIDEIIENSNRIPKNWQIIIHNRYGKQYVNNNYIKLIEKTTNIHLSNDLFNNFEEMAIPVSSADLGIAFYNPINNNKYDGKNIQHIGLSSGKISTYLQNGIPIATNKLFPVSQYIDEYKIGFWVENVKDFGYKLQNFDNKLSENCYTFYNKFLNLDLTIKNFSEHLKKIHVFSETYPQRSTKDLLTALTIYYQLEKAGLLQLKINALNDENRNLSAINKSIRNSNSFKLGYLLLKPISFIKKCINNINSKLFCRNK